MALDYLTCPHCQALLRNGQRLCSGCDATIRYGAPSLGVVFAAIPAIWAMVVARHVFYDSRMIAVAIGTVVFGGIWALISMAFDDRVAFRRPRRLM